MSELFPFVVVSPRGVEYVGLHKDESETWRIALGWPTVGEVKERQRQGWYVAQATLQWEKP